MMRDATTQLRRLGYINQDKQAVTSLPTPINNTVAGSGLLEMFKFSAMPVLAM